MRTKNFKRFLSVALAVCVLTVLGLMGKVPQAQVQAGSVNYAFNPSFEEGSATEASRWGLWPGWDTGSFIGSNARTGDRAIEITLNNDQNYALYEGGITPEIMDTKSAATLSMWVNYTNITDEGFMIGAERKTSGSEDANVFSQRYTGSSDGWTELTLELPATDLEITEVILKCEIGKGSGNLLIDDVTFNGSPVAVDPDKNYAFNPSFEEGSATEANNWGLYPGWDTGSFISSNARTGDRAIGVTLSEAQNYALFEGGITPTQLDTQSALILSFWVNYTDITGEGFMIGAERKTSGSENANVFTQRYTGSSDGWTEIKVELPATDLEITEIILKSEIATGSGTLLIDDVSLKIAPEVIDYEKNYAFNPSFEEGSATEANNWGLYPGWDTGSFISSNARTGDRAIGVTLSEAQNYALFEGGITPTQLDTQSALILSFWVNYTDITGEGFMIGAERKTSGSENANVFTQRYTGSSDGWTEIKVELPATDLEITEIVLKCEIAAGSGTLLIDDVSLKLDSGENPDDEDDEDDDEQGEVPADKQPGVVNTGETGTSLISNPGFEDGDTNWGVVGGAAISSDDTHSGAKAVKAVLGAEGYGMWNNLTADFDKNTALKMTFWVKLDGVTGDGIEVGVERNCIDGEGAPLTDHVFSERLTGTSDWKKVTVDIPATEGCYGIVVKANIAAGEETVYFDDFFIGLAEPAQQTDNYLMNPGFETGSATEASSWGLAPGWDKVSSPISTADVHGGNRAVSIAQGTENRVLFQSNNWGMPEMDLSQAMVYSAWVKYDGITGNGVYLKVERKANDEGVANVSGTAVTGTSDGWVQLKLLVPATTETIDELIVSVVAEVGTGTVIVDDAELRLAGEDDLNDDDEKDDDEKDDGDGDTDDTDDKKPSPTTGGGVPAAMALVTLTAIAAIVISKKRK